MESKTSPTKLYPVTFIPWNSRQLTGPFETTDFASGRIICEYEFRYIVVQGIPGSYFAGASRLLSVTSSKPKLVSVCGCSASVVQAFDDSEEFLYVVQDPFHFDVFSLSTIMYQTDAIVFGTVDIFSLSVGSSSNLAILSLPRLVLLVVTFDLETGIPGDIVLCILGNLSLQFQIPEDSCHML